MRSIHGFAVLTAVAALACAPAEDGAVTEDTDVATIDVAEPSAAAADPAAIRQGIDSVNTAAEESIAAGDVAGFVRNTYTTDATILPPGAGVIEGHEAITEFWNAAGQQLGLTGVDLSTEQLVPMGQDMAYEIGTATLQTGQGPHEAKYVVIWKRGQDGQWRWHVDMWNDAEPADQA